MEGIGVEKVLDIASTYVGKLVPDLYVVPDLDAKIAVARTRDVPNSADEDYWEALGIDFHDETRYVYQLLSQHPIFKDKWLTIDGTLPREEVAYIAASRINNIIENKLGIEIGEPDKELLANLVHQFGSNSP